MKTLDEVIKALELCSTDDNPCDKCPYTEFDKNGVWACSMCGDFAEDALYYLKTIETTENLYHDAVTELSKWKDEDWKDRQLPLTWDELKRMEGKPVWIELLKDGAVFKAGWYLIIMVDDSLPDIPNLGLVNANGEYSRLEIEWMNMGQWKAYRKERK